MIAFLTVVTGCLVVGVAVAIGGWRGRRVDDHRLCRRCGFDLTGTPEAAVCNECGVDLSRRRAVTVGHRQRRRGLLTAGLALVAPALLIGSAVIWGEASGVDWNQHKPAWWLARDIRGGDAAMRVAALDEFLRRLNNDRDGNLAFARGVEAMLAWQGDLAKPWDERAGEFIVVQRSSGHVDAEQWRRFARQGFVPKLNARPAIRQGDPLPVILDWDFRWDGSSAAWHGQVIGLDAAFDGQRTPAFEAWLAQPDELLIKGPLSGLFTGLDQEKLPHFGPTSIGSFDADQDGTVEGPSDMVPTGITTSTPPGMRSYVAKIRISIGEDPSHAGLLDARNRVRPFDNSAAVATWETTLVRQVDVQPSGGGLTLLRTDPTLDQEMQEGIFAQPLRAARDRWGRPY